ncbi:hypothetical protein CTEN210_12708 [Chaetoceros tenuissimus]|uniref:Uncharacterized protein n=1 Tax=Chaetoceros tenuissimus TaxID=426638 RepID=A0AAD3D1P5_9STRA|nr:hypothetical protein CTEN210_12708 [Chaetoceros tenuissimus]
MKASLRHFLTSPLTHDDDVEHISLSSSSIANDPLKERILNSKGPPVVDEDEEDLITSSTGTQKKASEVPSTLSSLSSAAPTARTATTSAIMDVHPSKHIMCHVIYQCPANITNAKKRPAAFHQIIVVRNYHTNEILHKIPLTRIIRHWMSQKSDKPISEKMILQTCQNIGYIKSIQFIDEDVNFHYAQLDQPKNFHKEVKPYLALQFQQSILLYKDEKVMEINASTLNNAIPTSKPIPVLSTNLIAVGCSDGAMRFYSLVDGKIVKSVRGPNGRSDPVIHIVAVQPYRSGVQYDMKLLTVCASGTGYVWDMSIMFKAERVKLFKIRSPLVKLDVYDALKRIDSSSGLGKVDLYKVHYCSDRNMLYWVVQQQGGVTKTMVIVWEWNLDNIFELVRIHDMEKHQSPTRTNVPKTNIMTPLFEPSKIVQIPSLEKIGGEGEEPVDIKNLITGLIHPCFSEVAIMSLTVSSHGDLVIFGSNRFGNKKEKEEQKKSLDLELSKVYYKFPIQSIAASSTDEKIQNFMEHLKNGKLQVKGIMNSRGRPDWLNIVTNAGILVMKLCFGETTLLAGSHHVAFPVGRGNGLITVEDSNVYSSIAMDSQSTVGIPSMNQTMIDGPNQQLGQRNKTLVYVAPPPQNMPSEFQARPVRMPPLILPSPSGKFLCLFWNEENKYEILHMESLTNPIKKPTRDHGKTGFPPAVDFGFDVLSFAWVGDEDTYALLYPPELRKDGNEIVKNETLEKRMYVLDLNEDEDDKISYDPAKFKPRVELKELVGVIADASQFGGSIAAATASFLGTLQLRGRHAPTCLFGGPVLCVGSFLQDKDEKRDGNAYFYGLRKNAADNRAASYISLGPTMPYPEYVVWDDEGVLCATIIERRIAIYICREGSFMLLGTTYLGMSSDGDVKIHSAKFLQNVLYCSTEKSIQCIFLGDLYSEDAICEIDSIDVASMTQPLKLPSLQSIDHTTHQQISLSWPSILCYHQGNLLLSSSNGVSTVSLDRALLRIGTLLSAGLVSKAQKWIESIDVTHKDYLDAFLVRRGYPELTTSHKAEESKGILGQKIERDQREGLAK